MTNAQPQGAGLVQRSLATIERVGNRLPDPAVLFIGLLVNTMQSAVEDESVEEFSHLRDLVRSETDIVDEHVMELMQEVKALRREVAELKGQTNG